MSDVQTKVIQVDGSTTALLSDKDQQLLTQVQALLSQDPHFQALNAPTLSRVEVNAGQQDTEAGYLYLRYDVSGAVPQEFWGHWGSRDHVAFKSGQVSVKATEGPETALHTQALTK